MIEHREYIGTICPPFSADQKRQTKNGYYVDFNLDCAGKVIPCRVWEEVFQAAGNVWEVGKKLALFGYLAGQQLRVKVAREAEKPAIEKHLAINGETRESARQEVRERIQAMAARGIEAVIDQGGIRWMPAAYCHTVAGRRMSKIDYCVDRLGGRYVVERLREKRFVNVSQGGVRMAVGFAARYRELLEELVREAERVDAEPF